MSETIPATYAQPVDQLLSLGRPDVEQWQDYAAIGITSDHVAELIRLMEDPALLSELAEEPQVYSSIHAWRALGQLRSDAAIEPLLRVTRIRQTWEESDEWAFEEIPHVMAMIGPAAVPMLTHTVGDASEDMWVRAIAAISLKKIAQQHADVRKTCVAGLIAAFEQFREQSVNLNAMLVCELMDLKEANASDTIRNAFIAGMVDDLMVCWGDVRSELKLSPRPDDPPSEGALGRMRQSLGLPPSGDLFSAPKLPGYLDRPSHAERNQLRAKRKAQRKAKKKNRRR